MLVWAVRRKLGLSKISWVGREGIELEVKVFVRAGRDGRIHGWYGVGVKHDAASAAYMTCHKSSER
jgi:hypothetical protein